MKIFEVLSFDFGAFIKSTPGILIIVGIVLLIVAVVFLMLEKKSKKKEEPVPVEAAPVAEVKEETLTPVVVATEGDGVKEIPNTSLAEETVNFSETPVLNVSNEMPVLEPAPVVLEKAPEEPAVVEVLPTVTPVVENLNLEPAVEPTLQIVEPTVYGGATPESTVNVEAVEEKPREIYGGANPLENTAPIPSNTVKEAYKGAMSVEKPDAEPTVVTPTLNTVVETLPVQEQVAKVENLAAPVQEEVAKVENLAAPVQEEVEKLEF